MRSKTFDVLLSSLLFALPLALTSWSFIVIHQFHLGTPYYKDLLHALGLAFHAPNLIWITYGSLIGSLTLCGVGSYLYYTYSPAALKSKDHIRGSEIIDPKRLMRMTLEKNSTQTSIADVPIPSSLETLHFLIGGRTGTGKTVAIKEMLSRIIPRGDRVIITDPNGDFLSHFSKKEDVILNPFDLRGKGWSIFNELNSSYDHERYAKSVIPPARSMNDAEWHGYAQLLFSETSKKLFELGNHSTKALMEWLTLKPVEELKELLEETAAAGLFDPGASKALASTRFIIAKYIAPHQYLKEGSFSLRNWLKDEQGGNLYITWREDMADALCPLISTWLDILATSILSLPPSETRRVWMIIDELASLERLNSLEAALTKGRKHGLRIIAGLQSTAQLEHLYGREKAIVLRSCFSNLLILGGTASDPQTAEDFSRGLGERDVERAQNSSTKTKHGTNKTEAMHRIKERVVLPSEIIKLATLTGYLSLAGHYPVAKIKLNPISLKPKITPFEE